MRIHLQESLQSHLKIGHKSIFYTHVRAHYAFCACLESFLTCPVAFTRFSIQLVGAAGFSSL